MFSKIKNKFQIDNLKQNYPFIFFLIILLLYHILMREYTGDAVRYFSKQLDEMSLMSYLSERYNTWSSRLFIEIPLVYLAAHMNLFRICNMIMYVIYVLSLNYLTHSKSPRLVFALVLMYPIREMASAGWIATCVNYLWPVALLTLACVSLEKMYCSKKIYLWEALIYFVAIAFATNQEQCCVMTFIILTCFGIYCVWMRRFKSFWICVIEWLITVFNLLFALTCPGNVLRSRSETLMWLIDYESYSVFDKVFLGISTTFDELVSQDVLFLVFSIVIFLCTLKNSKDMKSTRTKKILCTFSGIPVLFVVFRTVLRPVVQAYFPTLDSVFESTMMPDSLNYFDFKIYIPFMMYVMLFICILVVLLNLFDEIAKGIEVAVIFFVGVTTRVMMGFSPTIYASDLRTFLFLKVCIIFCILRVLEYCDLKLSSNEKINIGVKRMFIVFAVLSILNNIVMIY